MNGRRSHTRTKSDFDREVKKAAEVQENEMRQQIKMQTFKMTASAELIDTTTPSPAPHVLHARISSSGTSDMSVS